jgi:hypothetical protein
VVAVEELSVAAVAGTAAVRSAAGDTVVAMATADIVAATVMVAASGTGTASVWASA